MEEFDIATYISAVLAVGTPLVMALFYIIKKGSPYLKKWLDKVVSGFDELSANFSCHTEEIEREKVLILNRLEKGDKKFGIILEKIEKESRGQSDMLDFMNENRNRIINLEKGEILKDRKALEKEIEEFKKKYNSQEYLKKEE